MTMKKHRILSGLQSDAMLRAVQVPDKPTQRDLDRVRESLRAYKANNGLSWSKIAVRVGLSRSTMSEFLGGRYKGNVRKVAVKIAGLLNSAERKGRRTKYAGYVETTVAKWIGMLVTQAEAFSAQEGKIGLIIGDGGHGKSLCLREYVEANKNAVYIELDDTMTSAGLFREIAAGIKIPASGSLATLTRRLILNLKSRHTIIILDEASGLSVKQLNQLRQIVAVKSRCPLILAGNGQLLQTMMQPATQRGHESLDQVRSRLMGVLNLDMIASDGDGGLYTAKEIRWLYEFGGISLTDDAVKMLQDICRTPQAGRLRTCSHIIAALRTSSVVEQRGCIDAALIRRAIEQLRLPIAAWLPVATMSPAARDGNGSTAAAALCLVRTRRLVTGATRIASRAWQPTLNKHIRPGIPRQRNAHNAAR
jgi:DNA transposition AAA+ family ATPase